MVLKIYNFACTSLIYYIRSFIQYVCVTSSTWPLYDHKGNLLYKAGYKVNPLNQVPLRERLIFINGDNEEQVKYALQKRKEYRGLAKIILTKGAPLEIQRREKVWMYFDQQGVLTTKLGIKAVPALVEQSGLRLKIIEVGEEEWGK